MSKISQESLPSARQDADAAIIGVNLGKTVFQLCVADSAWRVTGTLRLSRIQSDAADAAALLAAARSPDILSVRVKSIEQQALQCLHRTRSIWVATRTACINALRGFCREFGIAFARGSRRGIDQNARVVADTQSPLPNCCEARWGSWSRRFVSLPKTESNPGFGGNQRRIFWDVLPGSGRM
jgi:hypothetical protein